VGQLYELSGPRSLTFAEAAAEIAQASGHNVRYVPVSLEQHAAEAAAHGVPTEVVELLTYLFSEVQDGRNAATTDGVRRALGREPRDFADYARAAAATGVWGARPPPEERNDGRAPGCADHGRRPWLRAERGGLLRLLQLRDEGPRPPPAGPGHRRHAVDQPDGGHPLRAAVSLAAAVSFTLALRIG
jgi:hypothetical protein